MGVILGVFGGRWVTGEGLLVMVPPGSGWVRRLLNGSR